MKGIILAGGAGTRLNPLTIVTSKQLLPVYNRPMIYYPLKKLLDAGITEILIIVSPDHAGDYMRYLGSGKEFGAKFTYEIQDKPGGLAEAFIIGEDFIDNEPVALILGDNIFEDDFKEAVEKFKKGAHIFAIPVHDPERFGVVQLARSIEGPTGRDMPVKIVEKDPNPPSNLAIPGMYIYDERVVAIAKSLKPSGRGELEITDLHKWYMEREELTVDILKGRWIDAGTFDSLYEANRLVYGWEH